ncbi:hypothetical protein SS50377_28044 [Spironucleus salmonicida]|uniref:Uncharacterized protein n=1 Tax=Spironucleus salmonicida TaxID=348837 RepID=V6LE94_9EUKA|nr:hypothetical protein SS50377_28044 [Spironucleus salmonicida]|eukprot:EST42598.1 Hypothetical protein SS50377_17917 [Spironucleus salmonicida]
MGAVSQFLDNSGDLQRKLAPKPDANQLIRLKAFQKSSMQGSSQIFEFSVRGANHEDDIDATSQILMQRYPTK